VTAEDPRLLDIAAAISDGEEIDWAPIEDSVIRSLRIVADVARLHRTIFAESMPAPLPASIGRYRILRQIAEGGMGSVYEAEQDRPRRAVALKVIRPGCISASALRRFERETEVLARLDHPGIAKVFDAGIAEFDRGAQPYFAMELIRGEPLLAWARQRSVSASGRIELLAKVADAVEHAHQRGVIHRDLKPANILVDETGQPKVLDFGVARVTDSDLQSTMKTDVGQLVGTLSYMSPEQIAGDPVRLDRRSDVYTLGVVLFELLTGRLPYELSGMMIPDIAITIREQEPSRLGSFDSAYRGDLETIVLKTLEKDPQRRYATAADLARDLGRYLRREPIAARPSTTIYQLRKFARRRPEIVLGITAVFVVLVAGIVGTTIGLARAMRQRDLAAHQAQRAERLTSFMQDLLASARPGSMGRGREVRVADMLARAAATLPERFADEPDLEMAARSTLGQTYVSLGLYDEAFPHLTRAWELAQANRPEGSEDRLQIAERLSFALAASSFDFEKGEELARANLSVARRVLGPSHPTTLALMNTLSFSLVFHWKLDDVQPLLEELCTTLSDLPPERRGDVSLAAVASRLAFVKDFFGTPADSEDLARKAVAEAEANGEATPADFSQRASSFAAATLIATNRLPDAEQLLRRTLAQSRQVLGRYHEESLRIGAQLAEVLRRENQPEEALELYQDAVDHSHAHPTGDTAVVGDSWAFANLANLQSRTGRYDDAARNWRKAIAILRHANGDSDGAAQAYWRDVVMRLGLGIQERWASDVVRTHVGQAVWDFLTSHPTTTFSGDEMDWSRLRFRLDHGSEGNVARLRSLPTPRPGLHRLFLDVPRHDGEALRESSWMLVSTWSVDVYGLPVAGGLNAWRGHEDEVWRDRLETAPDEHRRESSLAYQGWLDTGFGPNRADNGFGLRATTTVRLPAGSYRFLVTASDGARLWVDDKLVIDAWNIRSTTTDGTRVELNDGPHVLRVDYFQAGGEAVLWVRAEPRDFVTEEHS
jgi:tetratricopeptide (TPR) repeat protein